MDIYQAAELLQEKLRGNSWFTAVAVGGLDEREVIFVYTRTVVRNSLLTELSSNGWMGFEVKVQKVGRAMPVVA